MPAASDVLRRAAELIEAGWSPLEKPTDIEGNETPVFGGTTGDTARAGTNKAIAGHTLYSAIVTAAHERKAGQMVLTNIWISLNSLIMDRMPHRSGGANYLHPVHAYNTAEDRTAEEVQALLNHVADDLDPSKPKDATAAKLPPVTL
jgi:hypothetical protein